MNNAIKRISKSFGRLQKRVFGQTKVPGLLGRADGTVVAGDGLVYVTLRNGDVIVVSNAKVPNRPYMKVWIGKDEYNPSMMQVLSERYVYGKPLTASLTLHGEKHQWPKEDTVWVDGNQFLPLLAMPGDTGDFYVKLRGAIIKWLDGTKYVKIQPPELDLSSLVPTDGAIYALLQVDDTGTMTAKAGTQAEAPELLTLNEIPLPDTGQLELWAVRLYSGMDRIHKDGQVNDFVDLRWGRGGAGGGGGGTWGSITGLLSDQADLQAALDAKQDTLGFTPEDAAKKGVANGYAELDSSGKVPSAQLPAYRVKLTANRTYYVRTDGNDSNDGLSNTSGGAFLTIQKAVDVIAVLDIGGYIVTIQVADGTYTGAVTLKDPVGWAADGNLVLQGNATTPANCVLSVAGHAILYGGLLTWDVIGFKLQTTSSGFGLAVTRGKLRFFNLDFGTCANHHIYCQALGTVIAQTNYAVSGGAPCHVNCESGNVRLLTRTITFSNSPAFSGQFAYSGYTGKLFMNAMTFTNGGTVTGQRYCSEMNAILFVGGGGATYLPGTVAGTSITGGQYA